MRERTADLAARMTEVESLNREQQALMRELLQLPLPVSDDPWLSCSVVSGRYCSETPRPFLRFTAWFIHSEDQWGSQSIPVVVLPE